jgi:diamine N-acetyltransferase
MMQIVANMAIRQAQPSDVELLRKLGIITFTNTYAAYNTPKDIELYIEKYFSRENLLAELNGNENYFFIAICNEKPVGYIKLRLPHEDLPALKNRNSIELERIYVLKELHGSGFGFKLIQYALDYAQQNGFDTVWLGVWKRNEKAINFYKKCGFEIFSEHEFMLGTDLQTDWLMMKVLKY